MKKKFICMLILCLPFLYFGGRFTTEVLQSTDEALTTSAQARMEILHSTPVLRHGDVGIITVQGRPGVKYTIRTSYRAGNDTIPVTQWRLGDSKGIVIFNWVVGGDTVPGTYPVTIYGDGETLHLTHTVVP